ncbi:MAG: hypothetical protein O7G83_22585 [Proteobacteria bacterium]|nr:hypothetical protein [Pseudomonadota bacterium]
MSIFDITRAGPPRDDAPNSRMQITGSAMLKFLLVAWLAIVLEIVGSSNSLAVVFKQGQVHVDPFGKAWQVAQIEHCATLAYTEDVWNAHTDGGFPSGRHTFQKYTEEFDRGAPKCRTPPKPIQFELVRIIKHAFLPWPNVGRQETYLIEIHIIGSPVNRFAIVKFVTFTDTGDET